VASHGTATVSAEYGFVVNPILPLPYPRCGAGLLWLAVPSCSVWVKYGDTVSIWAPRPYLRWCSCTTCEGVGTPPSQGVPPPKKGKRSEKRKEEKGQAKRKKEKNTGKAVYY